MEQVLSASTDTRLKAECFKALHSVTVRASACLSGSVILSTVSCKHPTPNTDAHPSLVNTEHAANICTQYKYKQVSTYGCMRGCGPATLNIKGLTLQGRKINQGIVVFGHFCEFCLLHPRSINDLFIWNRTETLPRQSQSAQKNPAGPYHDQ